jgi:type I restriction enzyme S subunit
MNAQRLLQHFNRIAEAPDAVQRLRQFILDLAVRGKLVEQDPNDEPASELLKRIQAEKVRLVRDGEIRKPWHLPAVSVNEAPFPLPANWQWVRFGDLIEDADSGWSPKTEGFPRSGDNWGVLKVSAVSWDRFLPEENKQLLPDVVPPESAAVHRGDFLISRANTSELVAKCVVVEEEPKMLILSDKIVRLQLAGECTKRFLCIANNSAEYARAYYAEQASGTSQSMKNVSRPVIYALAIPLPPLAEQRRIVAKVDELMALCDGLEAAQAERENRRDRLVAASLHRLNNGADADAFREHARFHLRHVLCLTTRPEHIHQLRQTILNLAVRGKLVGQDPNDEPAAELLMRARRKQARLVSEGKVKKQNALSSIDLETVPYPLPKGWAWARFPELGEFNRGKSRHRPRNDPSLYEGGKYKLVQTGDVARANGIIETHTGLYNDLGLSQSRLWPKGTMCITIAANIADSAILGFDACIPDSVVGFIPFSDFGNAKYFEFFMRTAKAHLEDFAPSTAQKNINIGILVTVLIPLPPIAEQHRIVAKVDELMSLCDRLEAQLTTTAFARHQLLEATIHQAISGRVELQQSACR